MNAFKSILFWGLALLHVGARIGNYDALGDATKTMLIPSLFFCLSIHRKKNLWLWSSVLFSWLGDLFLIPEGTLFFLLGIGAFWIAQASYCKQIITRLNKPFWKLFKQQKNLFVGISILGYLGIVLAMLYPKLDKLFVPVAAYATTLALTVLLARIYHNENKKDLSLFLGALLFMLSDSMIAFDAFYFDAPFFSYWIMITYIPAQYSLLKSLTTNKEIVP